MRIDSFNFNLCVEVAYAILQRTISQYGWTLPDYWKTYYEIHCLEERRERFVGELVYCSEEAIVAWHALQKIEILHLNFDHYDPACLPRPFALNSWLAEERQKMRREPKKRGRDPYDNFVRDMAIVEAVERLSKVEGIHATRNPFRKKNDCQMCCYEGGASACDIVGIAVALFCEQNLSYKRIEGIWTASGLPESPFYRFGPSRRPLMEHPICLLIF